MDERKRRLAENEALFRDANEQIESVATHLRSDDLHEFLCECADANCTFRLSLPLAVYQAVRSDPRQFVVLPFHFAPEIEELVVETGNYWIVGKTGEAGEYVERLDPRGRQRP